LTMISETWLKGSHNPQSAAPDAADARGRTETKDLGQKKPNTKDRREYLKKRRVEIRNKALAAVASYNGRPIECFRCGKADGVLELDHVYYATDSVRYGHSAERAEEAIKHPSRFYLLCRACHISKDLTDKVGPNGLHPRAEYGSEVRALEATKSRKARNEKKIIDALAIPLAERDQALDIVNQLEQRVKILEEEKYKLIVDVQTAEDEVASLKLKLKAKAKRSTKRRKEPKEEPVSYIEPQYFTPLEEEPTGWRRFFRR
jgi:hypothetical protein